LIQNKTHVFTEEHLLKGSVQTNCFCLACEYAYRKPISIYKKKTLYILANFLLLIRNEGSNAINIPCECNNYIKHP